MNLSFNLFFYAYLERFPLTYKDLISEEERRRRDRRIPRTALKPYLYSSFRHLLLSGNDQALLNATGHDHTSFSLLLKIFRPYYERYTWDQNLNGGGIRKKILDRYGNPKGRKRDMTASGCLGLVLMWFRTRGSCARALALLFGQTSTPMYLWLKFGRRILLHVLSREKCALISLPEADEVNFFSKVISAKYPVLTNVWAAADGLKLAIQAPTDFRKQNKYYNGWHHSHNINSVFVFSPDGKIRICLVNAPGTFHDSTMADYGVYEKMEMIYDKFGAKVVVNSAFKISGSKEYIIKSSQEDPTDPEKLLINRAATSMRQLSEWGMRMISGSFPRMKDPNLYEESQDRKVILRLMVHLHNYQASQVGINQILNSFYEKDKSHYQNEQGINADANFMLPQV